MRVDSEFIKIGMSGGTLNKAQFEILGQPYPAVDGWESLVVGKELSQSDANLFLLLRGKLSLKAQEQIIKNYQLLADFHKQQREQKTTSLESETLVPNKTSLKPSVPRSERTPLIKGDTLTIYCDGACKGNPGKAGSGLAIYHGKSKPTLLYGAYEERGTNNTAELNALYKALLIASESKSSKVTIYCDSKYSIDCITTWAYGWKKRGWKKKGGEIKNLAIIKMAHELYERIKSKVTIKHVKGHAGVEGNELADRMAVYAIASKGEGYQVYDYKHVDEVLGMSEG